MRFFIIGIVRLYILISLLAGGICLVVLGIGANMPPSPTIMYMAEKKDTNSWDLFMLDIRTGVIKRLTRTVNMNERYPAWSHDMTQLAYHVNSNGLFDIEIRSMTDPTTTFTPFVSDSNMGDFRIAYDKAMPAWSWDNQYLGFHAKLDNGRYGIFIGLADGKEMRLIVNPPENGDVVGMTFSPDNQHIAFSQDIANVINLYVLELPDTVQLATVNRANMKLLFEGGYFPSWSPDGTKLAFMGGTVDRSRIWIYDFATNTATQITLGNAPFQDVMPDWSSDGEWIVFSSNRFGLTHSLYMIRADGTGLRRLTFSSDNAQAPDWGIYQAGG